MYRSCIFCSADLGKNEALEEFPVGRRVAFDQWKGRLWAVCLRCQRWNLAPIEERWEAVEEAERLFRDSRVRVHAQNIGLARLPDRTQLIRVGEAVPLELAHWRYGAARTRRRRQLSAGFATTVVGAMAVMVGGLPFVALGAVPVAVATVGTQLIGNALLIRETMRPIVRVPPEASPSGREMVIRQQHSYHARVVEGSRSGDPAVELPAPLPPVRQEEGGIVRWVPAAPLRLEGDLARRFLDRTLVRANGWWASGSRLAAAFQRLESAGGPEQLIHQLGTTGGGIFPAWLSANSRPAVTDVRGGWQRFMGTFRGERVRGLAPPIARKTLPREDVLALEIALQEEAERRALEGELSALEAAWREAEEIAAIADRLPDDPLESLEGG